MEKTDELKRQEGGKMFQKKSNIPMSASNKKNLDAWLKFEETQNVGTFLKNVSYRNEILLGMFSLSKKFTYNFIHAQCVFFLG